MRSFLFVPGNRPERFEKALGAGADAVILDLEDAVAESDKALARKHIRSARLEGCKIFVRINAHGTPWFDDDLIGLGRPEIYGVVLPKAESAMQLEAVARRVRKPVMPIIESALGLWQAMEVARAVGVERVAFGSVDFQLDMGSDGSDEALLHPRSQLVLVSRVAGLQPPVDGVTVNLHDNSIVERNAAKARSLGFGGKLCIHPKQIPLVNAAFNPTDEEAAWARRVVDAYDKAGAGAVSVGGMMVDRPVLLKAQRILELVAGQ